MIEGYSPVVPEGVERAQALAIGLSFGRSCTPAVGSLLRVLAGASAGPVLELGTGCGVGSAWLLAGLAPETPFVTVERDDELHAAVAPLFSDLTQVRCLLGDWREALRFGPFSLAFVDVGEAKDGGANDVIGAMAPGGLIVLDDFEPGPLYRGERDDRWCRWMEHPALSACEVQTGPGSAVILAARK